MIQHFIITRFSYRDTKLVRKKGQDPLKEKNLRHRFSIFEIGCLPSVLNQTNQNFTWILIVDPQLPDKYRDRLQKLISNKTDAFLVNYFPGLNINRLFWLKPWIKSDTDYVCTIKLDDDDMLFNGYTQYLEDYFAEKKPLEPITFVACGSELHWDFYYSKDAPYGHLKTITKQEFPGATGFALCCKYPEIDFSIESFEHTSFNYLSCDSERIDKLSPKVKNRIAMKRRIIFEEIEKSKLSWVGKLTNKHFHAISTGFPQAIVINHFDNIQFRRVFTDSELRNPLNPLLFVPGFFVDFIKVEKQLIKHNKSLSLLLALFRMHFMFTPNKLRHEGFYTRAKDKIHRLRNLVVGFKKL